jgi:Kef-type K+ transport system membrane component KefB
MFAGIVPGPSLLGAVAPQFSSLLFPPSSLGFMNALSQIGIIIFMFLVGLGINTRELKKQGHAALLTSHISITGLWSSISGIVLPATP